MTQREKDMVRDAIYKNRDQFITLAHAIHSHPQLAFEEHYAATRLTEVLVGSGFNVSKGVFGMPTAFIASIGHGPLHIAFCAEYDALPSSALSDRTPHGPVGLAPAFASQPSHSSLHACGHHLIAGAAVAAATGLLGVLDELGLRVSVFGTPAEELLGLPELPAGHRVAGKIVLVEAGAFQDVHAALMVHPMPTPYGAFLPSTVYARQQAQFSTTGTGRHSLGATGMQQLEEALRRAVISQHQLLIRCVTKPEDQNGGARADVLWRALRPSETMDVRGVVGRCFQEVAGSHGVTVHVSEIVPYAPMRNDPLLSASYSKHAQALGRLRSQDERVQEEMRVLRKRFLKNVLTHPGSLKNLVTRRRADGLFFDQLPVEIPYCTDMGNVSQVILALHPFIGIGGLASPHSVEFANQSDTKEAYHSMIDGGIALAWTALDAATDPILNAYLLQAAALRGRFWFSTG
jgi:metal-dependent amidase/aminoacylase/carboxypeptidase family protein